MHFYSISAAEAKKIGVGRKLIIETTEMEGNVALSDANNAEIASLNLSDGVVSMNWTEEMAALAVEGMRVRLSTGTNNIVRVYTTGSRSGVFHRRTKCHRNVWHEHLSVCSWHF